MEKVERGISSPKPPSTLHQRYKVEILGKEHSLRFNTLKEEEGNLEGPAISDKRGILLPI